MTPDEYCADKVARRGSSLFYAVLRLPPEKRRAVIAVHAFRREVEDVAVECSDPALALVKLQWWRQQLAAAYGGAPQHPVARALQPGVRAFRLPESPFEQLIEGVEADLAPPRYPNLEALASHCLRTGSLASTISAEVLGYRDPKTPDCVRDLGLAIELSRIVRDVGLDARRERIYLPLDDLHRFAVEPEEILRCRHSDRVRQLIELQIDRVEELLGETLTAFPPVDRRTQRPLLTVAAISLALLREIRADGCRVLERRTSLTPLRKFWIAWRSG
jgi:phytoene synthase